jgi:hypothetical protein
MSSSSTAAPASEAPSKAVCRAARLLERLAVEPPSPTISVLASDGLTQSGYCPASLLEQVGADGDGGVRVGADDTVDP